MTNDIPRIVVTDGNTPELQLTALNFGADDWISRPFASRELILRVRALLQRSQRSHELTGDRAEIVIDSWAMKLSVRGNEVSTTALEFRLLEYLARHRGQVFTRDFLLDAVWGEIRFVNPRSVDACIRRIREKIESDPNNPTMLKTVRGVGYRLDARAVWQAEPMVVCDCPACRTKVIDPRWNLIGAKQRRATAEN
ncbi:MAG TPA: response regulator transcription factor [Candidatus Sulfotelmatobacter sp.]|nr:response regulator transcription factor [Candidatus Sulfotelmatobacter sp.]